MRRAVLDASVVLKWYLPDEDHGQAALELLDLYLSDDLEIIVPSLLEYEIINGLWVAQKRGRIKEEVIISAIEGFLNLASRVWALQVFIPGSFIFAGPTTAPLMMPTTSRWPKRNKYILSPPTKPFTMPLKKI